MSHTFRYSGPFTEDEGRKSVAAQKERSIEFALGAFEDDTDCDECGVERDSHDPNCSRFDSAYYTGSPEE